MIEDDNMLVFISSKRRKDIKSFRIDYTPQNRSSLVLDTSGVGGMCKFD